MHWFIVDSVLIIISMGAGTASILLSLNVEKRFKLRFLNSFMYFQMLLFVFGLYGLFGNIIVRNIINDFEISQKLIVMIIQTIPNLGIPVLFIAWFMYLKSCIEILGKKVNKYFGITYFTFVIIVIVSYILVLLLYIGNSNYNYDTLLLFNKLFLLSVNIVVSLTSFVILIKSRHNVKSQINKKLVGGFLLMNFISAIISHTSFYFVDFNMVTERIYLVMFFTCMLLPVWYLYFFFNRNASAFEKNDCQTNISEKIILDYQLTNREWEVIERICAGKTNNEISDELFISLQTVKDHVYRIFKKTGVKNRVQLVNFINDFC